MTPVLRVMTAAELSRYRNEPCRQELIAGKLHEMEPTGALHGQVAAQVGHVLAGHVRPRGLGVVVGAETGFMLARDPDTVRAPDAAFVRAQRIPAGGMPDGYWPGPPDVAFEVLSPNDRHTDVEAKALDWLAAGTRAVVILDPRRRTATRYRSRADISVLEADALLDLDPELAGLRVRVCELLG